MSFQVFVDGDGEQYWTAQDNVEDALRKFLEEMQPARRVSLVWEDFDYEPE